MASVSRTSKTLSLIDRIKVLNRLDGKETQASIAKDFGVHPSQISRILKHKDELLRSWQNNNNPDRKRKRTGKAKNVEEALLRWFSQAKTRQMPISGPLLMAKAGQLAEGLGIEGFRATIGWLERWKKRNNIKFKKAHREKQDSDDFDAGRWEMEVVSAIFKDYEPRDIFNAVETGLYWRAVADGTLAVKNGDSAESKVPKERMTLLLACNMDGSEKLEPLVIGNSKSPRCFKKLPVDYQTNSNVWMTSDIWSAWLEKLDDAMRSRRRKIAMLCDNCPAHSSHAHLTNVKLVFLPPNMTSVFQPMDQGIIANFKHHYRSLVLCYSESSSELSGNLTVLDSLHMQKEAWNRVTAQTIADCYKRASFIKDAADFVCKAGPSTTRDVAVEVDPLVDLPNGVKQEQFAEDVALEDDLDITDDEVHGPAMKTESDTSDSISAPTFSDVLQTVRDCHLMSKVDRAEVSGKPSVVDSFHMLKEDWNQDSPRTVVECYVTEASDGVSKDRPSATRDKSTTPGHLPNGVKQEEFVRCVTVENNNLPMSDDVADATVKSDESDTSDIIISSPVTLSDALQGLQTVRSYLEANGCEDYELLYGLIDQIRHLNRS